jgi:hypothetical protein
MLSETHEGTEVWGEQATEDAIEILKGEQ